MSFTAFDGTVRLGTVTDATGDIRVWIRWDNLLPSRREVTYTKNYKSLTHVPRDLSEFDLQDID